MPDGLRINAALLAAALFVGPANCEVVIGQPWRWVRTFALRAGLEVLRVGGKPFLRARELEAALEREAAQQMQPREVTEAELRAKLLDELDLEAAQ